jgi:SAM-dependent methyltransferase
MVPLYDQIGSGYVRLRRPDPRIAARIFQALGEVETVVNVGAGAGSYEPLDRHVIAVEPSLTMIHQRPRGSAPIVRASATHLPFKDAAFAAALAVLTVHHWLDCARGLHELARVARDRVVVVTWDPAFSGFWLLDDYFPAIIERDRRLCPTMEEFQRALGGITIRPLPIPYDCTDGFLGAYWRRPHAYLKPEVRHVISAFAKIAGVEEGLTRLAQDLADGTWQQHYGHLLHQEELDLGYRIVLSGEARRRSHCSGDCFAKERR